MCSNQLERHPAQRRSRRWFQWVHECRQGDRKGVELSVGPRSTLTADGRCSSRIPMARSPELGPVSQRRRTAAVADAVPAVPRVSTSGFAEWGTATLPRRLAYVRGDVSYITTRYGDVRLRRSRYRYFPIQSAMSASEWIRGRTAFRCLSTTSPIGERCSPSRTTTGCTTASPIAGCATTSIFRAPWARVSRAVLTEAALIYSRGSSDCHFASRIRCASSRSWTVAVARRRYTQLARQASTGSQRPGHPGRTLQHDFSRVADHRHHRRREQDRYADKGVEEMLEIPIGGTKQWISVRGRGSREPVLLMIHGGPASPEIPTSWWFPGRLGGLLYGRAVGPARFRQDLQRERSQGDPTTLSADASPRTRAEVVQYLRARYGKEKIFVLGHSWGSIVGLQLARATSRSSSTPISAWAR